MCIASGSEAEDSASHVPKRRVSICLENIQTEDGPAVIANLLDSTDSTQVPTNLLTSSSKSVPTFSTLEPIAEISESSETLHDLPVSATVTETVVLNEVKDVTDYISKMLESEEGDED